MPAVAPDTIKQEKLYGGIPDVHMNTARGVPSKWQSRSDVHMGTAKGVVPTYQDIHMNTAKQDLTRKMGGLKARDKLRVEDPEIRRKATVAQLYFLDYYFQMLGYLAARKERRQRFDEDTAARGLTHQEYMKEWKSYCGRERVVLRRRRTKLRVDQFHIIAQIGQGGFGDVYLARRQETGEVCALKRMRKKTLQKMNEIKHVLVERDILTATKTPWLVRLFYAFQDVQYVYLAMEYVPGGDFRTLLNNAAGSILPMWHVLFYVSEMFVAVNELHKLGYIHRDLKPENFLMDATGHVKLTDFGLATGALNPQRIESMKIKLDKAKSTQIVSRSTLERRSIYRSLRQGDPRFGQSIVGSPDYMAPEVLEGKPYSYSVDYWSLGCILYEFVAGFPPFTGETPEETWTRLCNWREGLQRPMYEDPEDKIFNVDDETWDMITMLITDDKKRYSTLDQVKAHPFFDQVPWDELRQCEPPSVPELDSETDVGYFDDFSNMDDMAAKYGEVFEKQKAVDNLREKHEPMGRGVWVGFTFGKNGPNPRALNAMGTPDDSEELVTIF